MKYPGIMLCFCLWVVCALELVYPMGSEWELLKDKDGIRTYRRDVPGTEIDEFKAETIIPSRIDVIGTVLRDVLAYPTWMDDCKYIRFIDKFDDQNFIMYQVQQTPWPLKNRDVVVDVASTIDWEAGTFTVNLSAIEDQRVPHQPQYVRITNLTGKWIVTSLGPEHTSVTYTFTADPAGTLPVSLINRNLQNGPYTTLQGLRRVVQESRLPINHEIHRYRNTYRIENFEQPPALSGTR